MKTEKMNMLDSMMKKSDMAGSRKAIIAAAVIAVVGIAWYAFRPELLFVDNTVSEPLPVVPAAIAKATNVIPPQTIASGMFHNGAHETKGNATIHRLADGKRFLRLTEFNTSNGPDVHVYLVAAKDAVDNDIVKSAGFVDLGKLKGNVGDQNYDVAADVDLDKFRAVTIWCARFGVNFGAAPLNVN